MTQTTETTKAPPAQRDAPPAELKELNVFLGSWKADGEAMPGTPTPGRMRTADTYEWYPGGFFLIARGELRLDEDAPDKHLWIFGYDPVTGSYPIHTFDGRGNYRLYQARVEGRTWTYTGEWERARIVFKEDGRSFVADWEFTKDGSQWSPLCHVTAVREGTESPANPALRPAARSTGLGSKDAAATIAVKEIGRARDFYEKTLGLKLVATEGSDVAVYQTGDSQVMVYVSQFAGTNQATALTWVVGGELEHLVDVLRDKGVRFEHYDLPDTTREGDIHVAGETRVAWFKDPDGNIISLVNT